MGVGDLVMNKRVPLNDGNNGCPAKVTTSSKDCDERK